MKTSIQTLLIAASLSLFAIGFAEAAQLKLPSNMTVAAVDGSKPQTGSPELAPGEHLLELKFADYYAVNAEDSGQWLRSGPLYVQLTVGDEQALSIKLPPVKTVEQGRSFLKRPEVTLSRDGEESTATLMDHAALMAWMAKSH